MEGQESRATNSVVIFLCRAVSLHTSYTGRFDAGRGPVLLASTVFHTGQTHGIGSFTILYYSIRHTVVVQYLGFSIIARGEPNLQRIALCQIDVSTLGGKKNI